jgi:WD40 repeat protein
VKWSPHSKKHFASVFQSKISIWDADTTQVVFTHEGHINSIDDFTWNPEEPFTIASHSDDLGEGGGTLQIWRMHDWLFTTSKESLIQQVN